MQYYIGIQFDPEYNEDVVEGVYAENYLPTLEGVRYVEITEAEKNEIIQHARYNDYSVVRADKVVFETRQHTLAIGIRSARNDLLNVSDAHTLPDRQASMTPEQQQAWGDYRQALRDVPQQADFPENVVWPVAPAAI